jgi:zinc protease
MRRSFLAALFFAAAPALSWANDLVTSFTLDNGMDVIVVEDHRAPVVQHMVWYRVGSADEPPGQSGVAHFLEHLMFKATDTLESGEFSATVSANGGQDNAFTSYDYTAYFQRVAADRLGLMMQMEADRMQNIRLTEEEIISERNVVLEERNQRTENNPRALFNEQMNAAQYLNHHYGVPIVGWKHEIEQLGMQEVMGFYERFYAPNNAILVVSGDVSPDQVRALAAQHYGPIPANPNIKPRARSPEPPHIAERRVLFEDARVATPYVARSYLAPERNPGDQRKPAALLLLAELLGGGTTSYMTEKLQFEEQIAVYSGAFYRGISLDATSFDVVIVPRPGVSLEEAEAAMDKVLQGFIEQGVDLDALERIKMQVRASEIYARDAVDGIAQRYGQALTSDLTVEDVQAWPGLLQDITPDEIIAAAKDIWRDERSVTGYLMKAETTQ